MKNPQGPRRRGQSATMQPLYAAVAKELTNRVSTGRYPRGELIPTEFELSKELRVSRQTIREAIRLLADAGLVSRHPGIGTRVRAQGTAVRVTYPAGSLSDIVEHARENPLKVSSVATIEARGVLATVLKCRQGSRWLHAVGLRYHKGEERPLAVSELFIRDKFPGLERRLFNLTGPVYMVLETYYDEVISQVEQEILSITVSPAIASQLNVEVASAGLEIRRRFFGRAGRLILYGRAIYPAHRFSYTLNFRRESEGVGKDPIR